MAASAVRRQGPGSQHGDSQQCRESAVGRCSSGGGVSRGEMAEHQQEGLSQHQVGRNNISTGRRRGRLMLGKCISNARKVQTAEFAITGRIVFTTVKTVYRVVQACY